MKTSSLHLTAPLRFGQVIAVRQNAGESLPDFQKRQGELLKAHHGEAVALNSDDAQVIMGAKQVILTGAHKTINTLMNQLQLAYCRSANLLMASGSENASGWWGLLQNFKDSREMLLVATQHANSPEEVLIERPEAHYPAPAETGLQARIQEQMAVLEHAFDAASILSQKLCCPFESGAPESAVSLLTQQKTAALEYLATRGLGIPLTRYLESLDAVAT